MKHVILLIAAFLVLGCASTQIVKDWKNPEVESVVINKVLVVGMTADVEARTAFESMLKAEFEARNIEAVTSLDLFEPSFTTEEKSKEELDEIEATLIAKGFDAILFTKVIGVEDKISYIESYSNKENTHRRFKDEYLMYQDVFYNPDYYNEYTVYHTESSLYCICPTKPRELVWKGFIDITEPKSTDKIIDEYVKLVIGVLENQNILDEVN